jgi:hypothetical protein
LQLLIDIVRCNLPAGLGIVIARRDLLVASKGRSPSPCLDLHDQWDFLQNNGFFRWTPPTHVMAALAESLRAHKAEGGIAPRNARYKGHWTRLVTAMRARGFTTLLPDADNAPIVTSFHVLDHPRFSFQALFDALCGDMDENLRQLGVGDLGVGRRVKQMAKALYGRIAAYEGGLATGDPALAAALLRNLYRGEDPGVAALALMVPYLRESDRILATLPLSALTAGQPVFAQVPRDA